MATVKDLVEDWIAIRSTLHRQLEMLELGQMDMGTHLSNTATKETIVRSNYPPAEPGALFM